MSDSESPKRSLTALYLIAAGCIVLADQMSKLVVLRSLLPYEPVSVTGFFNLTLVFNKGAAFGFLSNSGLQPNFVFTVLSIVILFALGWTFWSLRPGRSQTALAICLIFSGAVGNLIDRISRGHVVDFIDVHFAGWHFYTFNVADSAITIGATLMILDLLGVRVFFRKSSKG